MVKLASCNYMLINENVIKASNKVNVIVFASA